MKLTNSESSVGAAHTLDTMSMDVCGYVVLVCECMCMSWVSACVCERRG